MMNPLLYIKKLSPKIKELKHVVGDYCDSYAPEEFQRPEAWGKTDKKLYFQSLLMDRLEGNFVFVNVSEALSAIIKDDGVVNVEDQHSFQYLQSFESKGIKFITLDGNNRYQFLSALLNDEYEIPRGTYEYVAGDHLSTFVVGRNNNLFSKLPDVVQRVINTRQLVVSEYIQIDYTGLSQVFINVNSGVPLNRQEKRNAFVSPWADEVRKIRKENGSLLIHLFGQDFKRRLKGDEWIANTLDYAINVKSGEEDPLYKPPGVTQASMDSLYHSDIKVADINYYKESFTELSEYIQQMLDDSTLEEYGSAITRGSFVTNLFWMMCNGIETYEEAVKALIMHEDFYSDITRVNDAGNTFAWACGGTGSKNNEFREEILSTIVNEVTNTGAIRF
jgi:hypothetical protein